MSDDRLNFSTMRKFQAKYQWDIRWLNVIKLSLLHLLALHGGYYFLATIKWKTLFYVVFTLVAAAQGITAGAHRLWCHRSYKAKLPLRILLCFLNTLSLQNCLYDWVRDHRTHHKFTDTDADPHNINRGFFFSHVGWLMVAKHPEVISKGKTVDMSDMEADPVVMFQKKYYLLMSPTLCLLAPALIPWYYFDEDLYVSWAVTCMFRYTVSLHATWCINSVTHMWGNKPYDRNISPVDNNIIAIFTFGEGWHNYHHVFPWDYKTGELGNYATNLSTAFVEVMAKIGWAYDLKSVSPHLLRARMCRTGGCEKNTIGMDEKQENHDAIWGWGDEDIHKEDVDLMQVNYTQT